MYGELFLSITIKVSGGRGNPKKTKKMKNKKNKNIDPLVVFFVFLSVCLFDFPMFSPRVG